MHYTHISPVLSNTVTHRRTFATSAGVNGDKLQESVVEVPFDKIVAQMRSMVAERIKGGK